MKIAYCIRSLKGAGGMERVLANKANYLAEKLGYEVIIITLDEPDYTPFFEFSPRIRRCGLGVKYIDSKSKVSLIKSLGNVSQYAKAPESVGTTVVSTPGRYSSFNV